VLDSRHDHVPRLVQDGRWIAPYRSRTTASIVVQELRSQDGAGLGARRREQRSRLVAGQPRLALTLSARRASDIYVLDLATQGLTRITEDRPSDTERWSADGSQPTLRPTDQGCRST
jgi:Tol biopolymer transport system component